MPNSPRVSVIIDGDLLAKDHLGFIIDWKRFRDYLRRDDDHITTLHYHAVEVTKGEEIPSRPLHDWLGSNGFRTIIADADIAKPDSIRKARVSTICSMTVDIMRALAAGQDAMVLFSADAALIPVINHVRDQGVSVTLIYDMANCSNKLRRSVDFFSDISTLRSAIEMTKAA